MKKHWLYLRYVLRHKWFVFVAACRLGIPWLGFIHDWSKFRPSEWFAYVEYFYGDGSEARRAASREAHPGNVDEDFDKAWLLHQKRNKHHWQWWLLQLDDGPVKRISMPEKYAREMLADWVGAGRAISGRRDWRPWYKANAYRVLLHPDTRDWVEEQCLGE